MGLDWRAIYFRIFFLLLIATFSPSIANEFDKSIKFITHTEFTQAIGEPLIAKSNCEDEKKIQQSADWLNQVQEIKIYLDADKYLRNIVRKVKSPLEGVRNNSSRSWIKYNKAKIQFSDSECKNKASYRLTGDLMDHVSFNSLESIPHSIKIKLKDSSIDNIKKFKLFVPKTRGGRYEILNVLIHKKLGFIAPRTALIDVQIGGKSFKAIFQEDISKELLENNNFHEAILIEGDEGYFPLSNPRIINQNLIDGIYLKNISQNALETISSIYTQTSALNISSNHDNPMLIDFLPTNSKEQNILFNLLNFSLKTQQSLTTDDHRFFYDRISKKFIPIYYDGHFNERGYENVNFDFSQNHTNYLIEKLEKLDIDFLTERSKTLGANFSFSEINEVINNAIDYLRNARPAKFSDDENSLKKFENWKEYLIKGSTRILSDYNLNEIEISWINNLNELGTCDISFDNAICTLNKINGPKFIESYPFSAQDPNKGLFFHRSLSSKNNKNIDEDLWAESIKVNDTGSLIEYTKNIKVEIDRLNKIIYVKSAAPYEKLAKFKKYSSQLRIFGGKLINWNFHFDKNLELGYSSDDINRFSNLGLTGCITFNDIELYGVSLSLRNTKCEDSLHLVRVKGNFKKIEITNSYSDAIDADFSDLTFDKIQIVNAGNDCVDLSSGKYIINNLIAIECKDKGLSAGEKSTVEINNFKMKNGLIGLASKDSSNVQIKQTDISETEICLAAYQKKQEYRGGHINANKDLRCNNIPSFIQRFSSLSILN